MRYPEEVALYAASTAAAAAVSPPLPQPEISLRMLLEGMTTSSTTYKNLLVINTHGELLPMPPMRNYSDPAKDPLSLQMTGNPSGPGPRPNRYENAEVRVVSHPENLHYTSGSAVNLRVYAFSASTATIPGGGATPTAQWAQVSTMTVLVPGLVINPLINPGFNITVKMLGQSATNPFCPAPAGLDCIWSTPNTCTQGGNCSASTAPGQYAISFPFINGVQGTLITLYGTPLVHPYLGTGNASGLNSNSYLYGLEYIPSAVEAANNFTTDLTSNGTGPKNTTVWQINFSGLPDGQITFETRIGDETMFQPAGPTSGNPTGCPNIIPIPSGSTNWCSYNPPDLSRTYTWMGSAQPPATEQFQFIGDPAHMPYADVKTNQGYNWYFTQTAGVTGGYAGYTPNLSNGWSGIGGDNVDYDIPRFFQTFRQGLLNSNGLWTTMNGFSYYYAGLGGEMGYDSENNFTNGLPIHGQPWNPGLTCSGCACGSCSVNEITSGAGSSNYNNTRLIASAVSIVNDNDWVSLPWIGELYPSAAFSPYWVQNGNLPTGNNNFYREVPMRTRTQPRNFGGAYSFTYPPFLYLKRNNVAGCSSFLNAEPLTAGSNKWFQHDYGDGDNGLLTNLGVTMGNVLNFPTPTTILASRPFRLDYTRNSPPEWNIPTYQAQRGISTFLNTVTAPIGVSYQSNDGGNPSSTWFASGFVKITTPTAVSPEAAYLTISGLQSQANFGTGQLGEFAMLSMVYGYLGAGDPVNNPVARVPQLPLVSLLTPATTDQFQSPTTINVVWVSTWTRWDGQPYTASYPPQFAESLNTTYNLKYSKDNGTTWLFVQDGTQAAAGVLDTGPTHAIGSPAGTSWTTEFVYPWNVSSLGAGNYLLRVEQYRSDFPKHYSHHDRLVYIIR